MASVVTWSADFSNASVRQRSCTIASRKRANFTIRVVFEQIQCVGSCPKNKSGSWNESQPRQCTPSPYLCVLVRSLETFSTTFPSRHVHIPPMNNPYGVLVGLRVEFLWPRPGLPHAFLAAISVATNWCDIKKTMRRDAVSPLSDDVWSCH